MNKGINNKSYTNNILKRIIDHVSEFSIFEFQPLNTFIQSIERKGYRKEHCAIHRLEQMGYIEVRAIDGARYCRLTALGIEESIKMQILNQKEKLPIGLKFYVSYDIPEKCRNIRNELRNMLKQSGFRHVHQSLWGIGKDVGKEILQFLELREDINPNWVHLYLGSPLPFEGN
ncbi:MAG: hypothetical protein ABIH21_00210 [Patescibacteria group bacterium]